jgi:hypothetical protein
MHLGHFAPASRLLRGLAATLLIAGLASAAHAQALDTPTLTHLGGGFFRIDVDVQAGPSGAPNGFVVQWMPRAYYEAYGWPVDTYDPIAAYCEFTGVPTLTTDPRSAGYQLGPNGVIEVQMGDLFDETGIYGTYLDAVQPGEYAFRTWALGDGVNPNSGSLPSATQFCSTSGDPECTQGFWKNHPELWPPGCTPMMLGNVAYSAAQLLAIYQTPAQGNGLISMAHQLITVELNECNGSNLANIAGDVAAAHALIGNLVIPPVGGGYIHPSQTSVLNDSMDDFNNGITPGVVACTTPARKSSWGTLKSLYR